MSRQGGGYCGTRPFGVPGLLLRAAPLVFRAPSGPAAREIATREPAAWSGRSRSPPVPSGPSGTLHTGGAWSLMCGSARWLEARPGPATAHGHRSQALRSLRRPPHQWRLVADVLLGPSNFACNSLGVISNHEFTPLGFQRFLTLLKILPIELHATYG